MYRPFSSEHRTSRRRSIEVVAEESVADLRFKKTAGCYFAFRNRYRIWGDAQALRSTYQDEPDASSSRTLALFLSADDPGMRQGFARIINRSDRAGTVSIRAIDDTCRDFGEIDLRLEPVQTRHFNSDNLESGDSSKTPRTSRSSVERETGRPDAKGWNTMP